MSLSAPTISATAKGPNQINLTWSGVSDPGYGYLVEIQSSGDSRYSSYTEWVPVPSGSGDAALLNTDPSATYVFNPLSNGLPPWVTESHYKDPQDDSAAQCIVYGLKFNTTYNFRVRTYSGYSSPTYSSYSNVASATTSNPTVRYVNTATGNDSNGGTNSTSDAWKTILKASSTLSAGQLGIVIGGSYAIDRIDSANAGSAGNKIVLMANPGDTVTITTVPTDLWVLHLDQPYWVIDGINSSATTTGGAPTALLNSDHCAWFGGDWNNKNQGGPHVVGDHNLVRGVYSHDAGNVTDDAGSAMYIVGESNGSASFNIIECCHITRGSHDTGIELNNSAAQTPERNQWRNNIHDGGWGTCWQVVNSTTSIPLIHHGLSEGNIMFSPAQLVPQWYKIAVGVSADTYTVRRNLMILGEDHAIEIQSQRGASTNNLIYNNTIFGFNQRAVWIAADTVGPYTNTLIANNIGVKCGKVIDPGIGSVGCVFVTYSADTSWVIEYNNFLYYSGSTPVPTQQIVDYNGSGVKTITYADANFAPFSFNDGLNVDPQFINEGTFDFHLGASSPMIGAGRSVTDATWGTIGQTDLGAFQLTVSPAASVTVKAKLSMRVL